MKKKFKIFLLAFLALIVIGGGYLLYIFQFKDYEVADEEIDEIMENPYDIVLPNGTKLVIDGEESNNDKSNNQSSDKNDDKSKDQQTTGGSSTNPDGDKTASGSTTNRSSELDKNQPTDGQTNDAKQPAEGNTANSGDTPSTGNNPGDKNTTNNPAINKPTAGNTESGTHAKKESVASIKKKYEPTVSNLQGQVDGKIDSLISRAKNEYTTKKANGESVNYAYFYNKYMSAAEGLEAQTDAVFNGVVSSLEKDLQANGFDKSYSKSVRDEYEAQKKARRDSILSKAMGK